MRDDFDVIVVGGGPAGLAAALHFARAGVPHLLLDPSGVGGLVRAANRIENLIGVPSGCSGEELAARMAEHALRFEVVLGREWVQQVARTESGFSVQSEQGSYSCRSLVLAPGTTPRVPDWPSWLALQESGRLHFDCRTLARDLRGKNICISGGGEVAFDTALTLQERGASVRIVCRSRPRVHAHLRARVASSGLLLHLQSRIRDAAPAGRDARLWVEDLAGPDCPTWRVDQVVVCHGRAPDLRLWRQLSGGPDLPAGVFHCVDLERRGAGYVSTALACGTRAAERAESYLKSLKEKER